MMMNDDDDYDYDYDYDYDISNHLVLLFSVQYILKHGS